MPVLQGKFVALVRGNKTSATIRNHQHVGRIAIDSCKGPLVRLQPIRLVDAVASGSQRILRQQPDNRNNICA